MADFYYQTSVSIRAPWLLDTTQLYELDTIATDQWKRLNEYREKKIEREVKEALPAEIESAYPKPEKKKDKDAIESNLRERISQRFQNDNQNIWVSLNLAGGKKVVANSIKEAIQHVGVADADVENLSLIMRVADVSAEFEIDTDYNRISFRVSPEALPESRETFAAIRDWISKHQPSRWQVKWGDISVLLWMILIMYAAASVVILDSKSRNVPSEFKSEAVEMVKQGINSTNQTKAIQLILALQTGYNPNPVPAKVPKWWLPSLAFGFLSCLVCSIKPSSHIGIGKAQNRVKLWRLWIRLLTIILPSLLFSTFAWPVFSDFIKSLFK